MLNQVLEKAQATVGVEPEDFLSIGPEIMGSNEWN